MPWSHLYAMCAQVVTSLGAKFGKVPGGEGMGYIDGCTPEAVEAQGVCDLHGSSASLMCVSVCVCVCVCEREREREREREGGRREGQRERERERERERVFSRNKICTWVCSASRGGKLCRVVCLPCALELCVCTFSCSTSSSGRCGLSFSPFS